jgi:carboxypeptidase C (cathepsin A)
MPGSCVAADNFASQSFKQSLNLFSIMFYYFSRFKLLRVSGVLLLTTLLLGSWSSRTGHSLSRKAGEAAYRLSVMSHRIVLDGQTLNYQSTTGYMPISRAGKQLANIFYTAYTLADTKRPVTFVFNGGPGSAAIWLHMGSFGPVRVLFKNDKGDAAADGKYGDNPYSWLAFTDLVFIDPVSTGYSCAEEGVDGAQFSNYQADISTIGEFIQNYLTQNQRKLSPKFLAGESYGAIRAIGLAEYLQDQYQISLNGITLISPALNYQLISFRHGNETPYSYYLPSYAISAKYHHRLPAKLQDLSIEQLRAKARVFAQGTYTQFLNEGDAASAGLTSRVIDSLHDYTGLSKKLLLQINGRISEKYFTHALLEAGQVTGIFDTRFTGVDKKVDPSEVNLRDPFMAAFNHYVQKDLAYQNNLNYQATTATGNWNYGPGANNSYLDISETLKKVMNRNPSLKVNIAVGYYDLATPVESTEYVLRHLGLKPELRNNISVHYYESGHMIYVSKTANAKLKTESEAFYKNSSHG